LNYKKGKNCILPKGEKAHLMDYINSYFDNIGATNI